MQNPLSYYGSLIVGLAAVGMLFTAGVLGPTAAMAQDEEKAPCPTPYIFSTTPRAAKIGDEVAIRGNRFGKEEGVVFFSPGVNAKILSWEYLRISVIVPEGAETGTITITASCGEGSNQKPFTILKSEEEK
jgi:hypothetical protein